MFQNMIHLFCNIIACLYNKISLIYFIEEQSSGPGVLVSRNDSRIITVTSATSQKFESYRIKKNISEQNKNIIMIIIFSSTLHFHMVVFGNVLRIPHNLFYLGR
jgi:hypothetical protein